MDLLSLAKGPLLTVATTIFIVGVVWRIVAMLFLRSNMRLSPPRRHDSWKGISLTALRSWPRPEFRAAIALEFVGYAFHLGLFVAVALYMPHVLFFEDIINGLLPFNLSEVSPIGWPTLPGSVIYAVSTISLALLLVLILHRLTSPVKRLISNLNDYLSWFLTIAPLATGMVAYSHMISPYQNALGLHILSVEALMIWFPFGKLMHPFTMFVSRGVTGILFTRKGAPT